MGANLMRLFTSLVELGDDAIRAVHPAHDRHTLARLIERFHYYEQGTCIVHHMFGSDVAARVRDGYQDAFVTAHLEVPGEMFEIALDAQRHGRGVVGSTSNILGFIAAKVDEAALAARPARLRFVLGTETGMVTSIVRRVRQALGSASEVEVEIVFPVASEAIARTGESELAIVPGVAAGEGCSVAGGCATCPYMKMNSLDALMDVLGRIEVVPGVHLAPFEPKKYGDMIAGRTAADLGGEPILFMRAFQKHKLLPEALVQDVLTRRERASAAAASDTSRAG
jgi:quinolinate synthase